MANRSLKRITIIDNYKKKLPEGGNIQAEMSHEPPRIDLPQWIKILNSCMQYITPINNIGYIMPLH